MLPIIPIRTWKRRHPILHRSTTPIRAHHGPSEVILFSATRSPKIKKQRPPDVCAQKMGIEETAAVCLRKVFRAALSLVGLFGLLRSWPRSARTVPRRWAGLDDRKPGSNHTFGNRYSVVRVSMRRSIVESESGSSRRAAMSANCGNCKSSRAADPQPSPLAPAGGVGRGRTAMFTARSRFNK